MMFNNPFSSTLIDLSDMKRIHRKLTALRTLDPELLLFGAEVHGYEMNDPLEAAILAVFERLHRVTLPEDYRAFLQYFGDGGAGPYYGLSPLGMSLFLDMDYPDDSVIIQPGEPFPLSEAFLPQSEHPGLDITFRENCERLPLNDGVLRLCNYGNGVFINLVVTGEAAGSIWTDARGCGGGLYPGDPQNPHQSFNFISWYEHWLDQSLDQFYPLP